MVFPLTKPICPFWGPRQFFFKFYFELITNLQQLCKQFRFREDISVFRQQNSTSHCVIQRGVTYFAKISAKTKLFAEAFQPVRFMRKTTKQSLDTFTLSTTTVYRIEKTGFFILYVEYYFWTSNSCVCLKIYVCKLSKVPCSNSLHVLDQKLFLMVPRREITSQVLFN